MQVQQVMIDLHKQSKVLEQAQAEINAAIRTLNKFVNGAETPVKKSKARTGKRKPMSAAARKKISEAAKARWAAKKAEGKK